METDTNIAEMTAWRLLSCGLAVGVSPLFGPRDVLLYTRVLWDDELVRFCDTERARNYLIGIDVRVD